MLGMADANCKARHERTNEAMAATKQTVVDHDRFISTLRDYDGSKGAISEMKADLGDHETRIRRNEHAVVKGYLIAGIVAFFGSAIAVASINTLMKGG